jgi:hypothetical protein
MKCSKPPVRYMAFLLRAWQEESNPSGKQSIWRFSLQDTENRQRVGFDNLGAMVNFLTKKCTSQGNNHNNEEE